MTNRRNFLRAAGFGFAGASSLALGGARVAFAAAPIEQRFILIFLRGGLDGLHALAPYADSDYRRLRPTLALPPPGAPDGVLALDRTFGLHPALAPLHAMYEAGEAAFVPAASTRYRRRSHFDAQNMLENGSGKPYGATNGWLNRALSLLQANEHRSGLALGTTVPLILQGEAGVQTWAQSSLPSLDDDFLARVARLYEQDPLLGRALSEARETLEPDLDGADQNGRVRGAKQFTLACTAAADLLARADGPRVAAMELQGWDTHFAQARRLEGLFQSLSLGLTELKSGLGQAWRQTIVMVVSEFGRTVAENASRGTDHGTGGVAILAGGAINGGQVMGQWPGLSDAARHDGRDVLTTNYYESLFKAVLISHLGLAPGDVERDVLPNSAALAPTDGIVRRA